MQIVISQWNRRNLFLGAYLRYQIVLISLFGTTADLRVFVVIKDSKIQREWELYLSSACKWNIEVKKVNKLSL